MVLPRPKNLTISASSGLVRPQLSWSQTLAVHGIRHPPKSLLSPPVSSLHVLVRNRNSTPFQSTHCCRLPTAAMSAVQRRGTAGKSARKPSGEKQRAPLRPSASILLVSPTNQVLLLHRVQTSSSFPSAHVFPGGNLSTFHDGSVPPVDKPEAHCDSNAYRLAAVRETFEESSILLARTSSGNAFLHVPHELREAGRKEVHANKVRFAEWLRSVGGAPDLGTDLLTLHFAHPCRMSNKLQKTSSPSRVGSRLCPCPNALARRCISISSPSHNLLSTRPSSPPRHMTAVSNTQLPRLMTQPPGYRGHARGILSCSPRSATSSPSYPNSSKAQPHQTLTPHLGIKPSATNSWNSSKPCPRPRVGRTPRHKSPGSTRS